ncbi:uncharacterized protein LOC144434342 [Glandiceps talaboti]
MLAIILLLNLPRFAYSGDTRCAIDQSLPATSPDNTYWCPDEDEDGNPNPYTNCCYNDRPDADGNYHNCCQSNDARDEEKKEQFKTVGIIVGASTGSLIVLVFLCCYCRSDTFKFIGTAKNKTSYCLNVFMDAICFCTCCCKTCRRDDNIEESDVNDKDQQQHDDTVIPMEW